MQVHYNVLHQTHLLLLPSHHPYAAHILPQDLLDMSNRLSIELRIPTKDRPPKAKSEQMSFGINESKSTYKIQQR